jgi:uncharacterized protein Yka (UPF0111/DUF47 family)
MHAKGLVSERTDIVQIFKQCFSVVNTVEYVVSLLTMQFAHMQDFRQVQRKYM